ncbi:hypothetical protein [Streptomyces sp. NPDC001292]
MTARRTWSIIAGIPALAVIAVLLVYGEHTGVILSRIALRLF